MNEVRPTFTEDMKVEEFDRYYWYRDELGHICRSLGIPASGTKAELLARVRKVLTGTDKKELLQTEASRRVKKCPEAIRRQDMNMCVADLITVYEQTRLTKEVPSPEERTYQWNRFVKDFSADPRTKGIKSRMKVAAQLWQQVRDRSGEKIYYSELLDEYWKKQKEESPILSEH